MLKITESPGSRFSLRTCVYVHLTGHPGVLPRLCLVTCLHAQESVLGELVENTSCAEFSQIHFTSAKLFGFIYQVLILGQNAAIGAVLYLF